MEKGAETRKINMIFSSLTGVNAGKVWDKT